MKQKLSYLMFLCLSFLTFQSTTQAQTLTAGDIAFVGYHTDSDDGFTFITLTDIPAGEVIYFTDKGWNATNAVWYSNAEDHIIWTAPAGGTSMGTVVSIIETSGDSFTASQGTAVLSGTDSGFSMLGGDSILAYQSSSGAQPANPTFIAGIYGDDNYVHTLDCDDASGWLNCSTCTHVSGSCTTTSGDTSGLPASLTNGENAIALFPNTGEEDNAKYTGTLTGTVSVVRAAIHNPANWTTNDSPINIASTEYSGINITADVVSPTVSSVSVPVSSTYVTGQSLNFIVNFSENVTVNTGGGIPQLEITVGSQTRNAIYLAGSGTQGLLFRYTIQAGDVDTDGIVVGTLSANGGTIQSSGGDDADLTLNSVGNTSNVFVDATAPTVSSVSVPVSSTYISGQSLNFIVNFNENVTVNTGGGTPQLAITVGSDVRNAVYLSGSGTQGLLFRYTIQAGDQDTDGIAVGTLSANGGTIKDNGGNSANLTLNSVGNTSNVFVDATVPTVSSVSVPVSSTYVTGQSLNFIVNFNENVTVNTGGGTPQLAITIGSDVRNAVYLSGSGTQGLLFRYTVQAGDQDTDGIAIGTLSANGGTIKDNGGNSANLTLNSVGNTSNVFVGCDLSASGVATGVSCNGGDDGSINLTVTGGTAPYTFAWNNTATTEDLSDLTAGTYEVTVTDANGCTATESVEVEEPAVLVASGVETMVSCNSGSDGSIDLTVTGGVAPYTYQWSNGETTEDISGLTAGTYHLIVVDANLCTASTSVAVTQPVVLVASGVATNVSCNGGSNGTINLTVTGGTPPYTYAWNNTATTEDLSGITAGTYEVTVTDAKGCTATESVEVTEPAVLTASGVATNVSCNGGNDGAIDLTVTGGTAPYTFAWNNTATTEDLSGLTAATYSVTVTDSKGCTATETVDVFEPIILEANGVATNVSCNGGNDGAVDLTVVGGNPPYTFAWNNTATTEDLSGLTAGTYSVTVTDSKGCTATETVDVFEPIILEANGVGTDATCAGNDGSVDLTVIGGNPPYTYAWSNSATTEDLSGLTAGTYNVTVTDSKGCTATESVVVDAPPAIIANGVATNVSCNGGTNGTIDLTVSGGTAPYTFAWNNTAVTEDLTGLAAGTYEVTVTDANGCTATESVEVTEPAVLTASGVATNVSCNGGNDGAIDLTVTGGTAPYTFAWNNSATTEDLSGLIASTYSVTVTDANGCTATETVDVFEPIILEASGVATNVNCNGGSNGAVDLTVIGGNPPYTFAWNNTATTEDLSGLTAGTYEVTVTDSKGCTATESVEVTEPAVLSASGVATNVNCNGGNNGTVDLTVVGGTAPYTFAWNNTATTEDLSGLMAGTYEVTVTDANGCTATESVEVTEPAVLSASGVATNVSCNGGNDGAIDLTVTGGTAPYTFAWNNSATTEDLSGLIASTYSVTVTDANGCTATETVDVFEPIILEASGVATNVSCNGGSNGTVDLTVIGGNPPYTYAWNNTATTEDLSGLTAGTYEVTVTDSKGCTATESVEVTEPTVLSASGVATNVSCNGGNNGTVDLTVVGGTAPYTFAWNNTATTEDLSGLMAGTYEVTVTDANGCTATESVTVTEPTALVASGNVDANVSCNGGNDGAITVNVTGGTGEYSYAWTGMEEVAVVSQGFETTGSWNYLISPAVYNTSGDVWNIIEEFSGNIDAASEGTHFFGMRDLDNPNGGGAFAHTITFEAIDVSSYGELTLEFDYNIVGFDTSDGDLVEYIVEFDNGTEWGTPVTINTENPHTTAGWETMTITVPASANFVRLRLQGTQNGGSDYAGFDNVRLYQPAAEGPSLTDLAAGTYEVTVTDENGCTATESIEVTEPAVLVASGVATNVSCNGGNDGAVDLTVTGGTAPYTFDWSNEATTEDLTDLAAGTYEVTVTDANGCTATESVEVTEPTVLVASGVATNVSCNGGSNGAVDLTVTGGTAPYTFAWDNTATTEDLTDLAAGTYEVTVTDANGCTTTESVEVTEPTVLVATGVATAVSCNAGTNGTIDLTVTGGTAPYTFAWDNTATTEDLTDLAAGTYEVTVTDANGCTTTESVEVTEPTVLVATGVATAVSCNAGTNGTIDLTVVGGTAPYTFDWNNEATTEDLTDLAAGTYEVTVTDANGCTATESVEVTEPTAIVVDVVVNANVTCNGGSTGDASVTVTGGTAPFEVTVNGTTFSNIPDNTMLPISGLSAGTYPVDVTDGNGCTATSSITITEPAAIVVDAVVDVEVSCFNQSDATVVITLTNGVAPFEYTINGTTYSDFPDSTLTVENLSAGTYPINVTDANGCTATGSVEITEPAEVMPPTADAQVFCNEGTIGDLVAEGTDVLWYDVETGGVALDASTDLATATYYATQTVDGCESPTRTMVEVTVNVTPAPSASAQVFCNEAMVSDLVSSGTDVLWYDVATGGEALADDTALATGTYYVSQTLNECESASRTAVSITVNVTEAPVADAQVFCNFGTVGQLEATGDNIQWYASETAVNPLATTANLSTGTYYVTQTMNDCESPRAAVEVTVNVTPAPAAIAQVFCNEAVVSDLVATGEGTILWYTEVTGGTALEGDVALSTGTYYASQVINDCESAARVAINVTVNVTAAPTADAQVFCSGAMVSDLVATGTDLLWYADETGGEALASDAMLATGTYYVSQTMNDCESPRTAVDVTVNVTEAPTADAQEFCNEAMVSDLVATGDNIQWYADETGGEALASDAMLATGTYYASQTMNDCESPRTAVDVTVNVVAAPVAEDQTICTAGTVADLVATGENILWYADETTEEPLAGDTVLVDGTTYYASQTVGTCESASRTAVMVTITLTPAPTGDEAQIVGENATFADLVVDGTDVVWYASAEDAANHENALDASTILENGVIYYATQTVDGCESVDSLAVTVTVSLRADVFEANKLTYYPVPVVDVLNVENNNMITSVRIINLMGQVVLTQEVNATTAKIDMRSLQGATYIMQVETETGVITVKVVKNSVN